VDLSQVPVDRTVAGAEHASQVSARGFTSPAGIVIPPEVGTLDAGPGQALLAHELTHVAQRVRLGPDLPAEHTPAGKALEAEALAAELELIPGPVLRPLPSEPAPRPLAPQPVGFGEAPSSPAPARALPLAGAGPGRAGDQASLATLVEQLSVLTSSASAPGLEQTVVFGPGGAPAAAPGTAIQRAERRAWLGSHRTQEPSEPAATAPAPSPEPAPDTSHEETGPFSVRPDEEDLTKLARWLYPLISSKIRAELREGRERAGMLTDTYRRW
jgi:hypothetical protein